MTRHSYDFVILGAGCAGLSLAMAMSKRGVTSDRSVLLVDPDPKDKNDRTWSYWETGPGHYDDILSHSWSDLNVYTDYGSHDCHIAPYTYKMLRGIDYYNYARETLATDPNVTWQQGRATSLSRVDGSNQLTIEDDVIEAGHVFKSYVDEELPTDGKEELTTLQHFGGWYIETTNDVWDPTRATFMDFRIKQKQGETRFCYVLPTSPRQALVEVAVYSSTPWKEEAYDAILAQYILSHTSAGEYRIGEREYGVIPMSTAKLWEKDSVGITHIGTAGGAVKPSSGYAFSRIQEHSQWITNRLLACEPIKGTPFNSRFYHYDATLLHVLLKQGMASDAVFHRFFQRNSPQKVLAFLNGETSFFEEIGICGTMPVLPFSRGLVASLAG